MTLRFDRFACMAVLLGTLGSSGCGGSEDPAAKPPSLTSAQCTAMSGRIIGDPGDGSAARNGCGEGKELLGWIEDPGVGVDGGPSICCK
jgi:hypothetical protein